MQAVLEPCYTGDMAKQRISVAPVRRKAEEAGIDTPNDLWRAIGSDRISLNTVKVWWGDVPMGRIDMSAWCTFADFFECDLLELVEEIK